jgi:hypothetical protein
MDEMNAVELTKQAMVVQDKTQESTSRAKKILEDTIQVKLPLTIGWRSDFKRTQRTRRKTKESRRRS